MLMKLIYFLYNIFLFLVLKIKKFSKTKEPPTPTDCRFLLWGNAKETDSFIPPIIWTYWSGSHSSSAEACLASLVSTNQDFSVIVLNDKNLRDYLPDFPAIPDNLYIQLVSDLIRLSLLEKYGGIWVDHSIIVNDSLHWIIDTAKNSKAEVVCFYNEHPSAYKKDHSRPIIENGFIAAIKGSGFITHWLNNFQNCIFSNNWKDYYRSHKYFKELTSNFRENSLKRVSYFSCYVAAQETMVQSNNHRLLLINVEDDFYFYEFQNASLIKRTTLIEWILIAKEPTLVPKLIKLRRMHRGVADACIRFNCYNRSSILGKYLDPDK